MLVQLCGLSGAGKTTLAKKVMIKLKDHGVKAEIIDGDEYRRTLCKDLGFSKSDRLENIRRLGVVAGVLSAHGIVTIISAINPYEEARKELKSTYGNVKTVYLECELETLISRDTKGLYKRALMPEGNHDKVYNLTGVNDNFDIPVNPDLLINTGVEHIDESATKLFRFIRENLQPWQVSRSC